MWVLFPLWIRNVNIIIYKLNKIVRTKFFLFDNYYNNKQSDGYTLQKLPFLWNLLTLTKHVSESFVYTSSVFQMNCFCHKIIILENAYPFVIILFYIPTCQCYVFISVIYFLILKFTSMNCQLTLQVYTSKLLQ